MPDDSINKSRKGSLTIVGSGIQAIRHLTFESKIIIEQADKVLYLVNDPVSELWVKKMNPNSESLSALYTRGKYRPDIYKEITELTAFLLGRWYHMLGRKLSKETFMNFLAAHPRLITMVAAFGISFTFAAIGRVVVGEILQPQNAYGVPVPLCPLCSEATTPGHEAVSPPDLAGKVIPEIQAKAFPGDVQAFNSDTSAQVIGGHPTVSVPGDASVSVPIKGKHH